MRWRPYHHFTPVNAETETVLINAVPLFVLSAAYAAVSAVLVPALWRDRRKATVVDITLAAAFPCVAVSALVLGVIVAERREPLGGYAWGAFFAIILLLVPALLVLTRVVGRTRLLSGPRFEAAEARSSELGRDLGAVTRTAGALIAANTPEEIARAVIDEAVAAVGVEFGAMTIVDDELTEARGLVARQDGVDLDWYDEVWFDLRSEPSGTATTVFERKAFALRDARSSLLVNPTLMERVRPQSVAFVPLIGGSRVLAVLVLATLAVPRDFSRGELELVQALANEAALALERQRTADALRETLERERLVARVSARFRSELDVQTVLERVVGEAGPALGVSRCFVRVAVGDGGFLDAEWRMPGLEPIAGREARLPVSNLAQRQARTVAIEDVEDAPELADTTLGDPAELRSTGTRAALSTPVIVGGDVLGAFAVHSSEQRRWSATDIAVAEAIAREVGIAVHVAQLLEENADRLRQQTALMRAAREVTSELELATVFQRLVDQVATLLEVEAADLYLYDEQRSVLRCAAVHGMPQELVGLAFEATRGAAADAIAQGSPVVSTAYQHIAEPVPHPAYQGFTDVAVAPMVWSDETRGVLGVATRGGRRLTGADADLLGAFALMASLALRNAEIYEETARRARAEEGLYRIVTVLGQSLSRAETLDAVAHVASQALGGTAAAVLLPARDGGLELSGASGVAPALAEALQGDVRESLSILALCTDDRRVIASGSLTNDPRFADSWRSLSPGALIAVPLEAARGDGCGVILVLFDDPHVFTDEDVELARHLASAARGALERSELYEAERAARALAQQLARTGSRLATELDPAVVLDEVVQRAPELLGADACAVRIVEEDDLVVTAASGDLEGFLGERRPISGMLSGDVHQSRSPVAVADAGEDDRYLAADPVLEAGFAAYLGVPLVGPEGATHGVLSLYARRPRVWRPDEVDALLALAANTSAALSNAELFTSVAVDRERSYAILANIAEGIVAIDRDGGVVLWNAAAERVTGVPAAEAMGRPVVDVLGRNLDVGGQPGRLVPIARGNEEVWLSVTEAVMRDPAGAVAGRIFAFRDISADRLVEEMKREFVATVSHELRGPLTSIYGFAQTLLREDVLFGEEERKTFLSYIATESARLSSIVDALLNVARLDTGDLQVNLQPTDVGPLLSEAVGTVEEATHDGHRFVVDLPAEPLAAHADRDKLRQILGALLDNAVKFSPSGGTVRVVARRSSPATIEVAVADEGVGIPRSEQERIFSKFYRGGDSSSGTGLGLFIAQGLVSAMGGRISVESEEGKGSRFWFELPLAPAAVGGEPARV